MLLVDVVDNSTGQRTATSVKPESISLAGVPSMVVFIMIKIVTLRLIFLYVPTT
jgi:hypothetical protein